MPKIMIPPRKPRLPREDAVKLVIGKGVAIDRCVLLFIRGYYLDSMGKFGVNDIGVYDDYVGIITPNQYHTFNANTDPSKRGTGLAMIKAGVHEFYKGRHKNKYDALRYYPEGERVPCTRDGRDSTARYINIHRGGFANTWSEGCLTVPGLPMYTDFQKKVYDYMKAYEQKTIKVVLVDEAELRKLD